MKKLSRNELEYIEQRERQVRDTVVALKKAQQFKDGDFLIAFRSLYNWKTLDQEKEQITNSYGAPKKYKVVHVDANDIPYMKELSKKGEPTGTLICPISLGNNNSIREESSIEFHVDPDYTDSIIMQDEENFDSSQIHREKSDTFKEIVKHNKASKIDTQDYRLLSTFFDTNVKVGTVIYKSINRFFTVIKINPVPRDLPNRIKMHEDFIEIQDHKGNIKNCCLNEFIYKVLYTQQPRSFTKELKDPK